MRTGLLIVGNIITVQDAKQFAARLREERDALEITLSELLSGTLRCWSIHPEHGDRTDTTCEWIALLERRAGGTSALIAAAERSVLQRTDA